MSTSPYAWKPTPDAIAQSRITDFMRYLRESQGREFADYAALWQWSVDDLPGFWDAVWKYFDLPASQPYSVVLGKRTMPGAEWFPGVRMNYVDQAFRHASSERPAIVAGNEAGEIRRLEWADLQKQVASVAANLRSMGVVPGDRVVAFMPNIIETIVAFYACASLGAVWSVCSPDMGPVSVLDRFKQIEPKVLFAVDGYRYGGKLHDRREIVEALLTGLPSVRHLVLVPNLGEPIDHDRFPSALTWSAMISTPATLTSEQLPFDAPLWVVYSSGTTGMPKPMVHGHGGMVIEHVKLMAFHLDLGPNDVYHWYSSTSWFMWNLHICGLLVGATVAIYDGNPGWPDWGALWRFAGAAKATYFGAGAALFASCLKADVHPTQIADLSRVRGVGSTGSPLAADCYQWIYDRVSPDVWLAPMSGGTDPATAFVGGIPILPVVLGEMQCKCLGAKMEAFDESGRAVVDEVGELVCLEPMPSMPLYFWNDAGGKRYHESYFDTFEGVWRHGDWVKFTPAGGSIIYGRSDATIKRHGIRMGTAELYGVVEAMPEIVDSIVVDLEYLGRESYMALFVVLREGMTLDEPLRSRIKANIRTGLSARHVPNDILQIESVPRTLSGKKLELPIKRLLLGQPLARVANRDSMANPSSLDYFVALAKSRQG
jgi:acetoacetyl-CoA synthetase